MFIDSHCHFFTKSILTDTTISFIKAISKRTPLTANKNIMGIIDMENFVEFINIGIESTPTKIYTDMSIAYQEDFIAVPLMLDLTFAAHPDSENASIDKETYSHNKKMLIRFLKQKETNKNEHMISNIITRLNNHTPLLGREKTYFKDSLFSQINELKDVKNKFSDRVFPFFSIDPRHTNIEGGILNLIKENVGKNKPFIGLKLYTSLGYSPTNPSLYNEDTNVETVYQWCEKNSIPITVHFSDQGFSNLVNSLAIKGHVYYPEAGRPVLASDLYEDSIIKYKNTFPTLKYEDFVKERLISLNHPSLWKMVLEKYPKLKINFAHFGGNKQIMNYLERSTLAFWTTSVIEMMHDYKNVYSDLSCFDTPKQSYIPIRDLHERVYSTLRKDIQDRILYGSDYFMLTLFETDLGMYLKKFKKGFAKDFKNIALNNPTRFLDIKIKR